MTYSIIDMVAIYSPERKGETSNVEQKKKIHDAWQSYRN